MIFFSGEYSISAECASFCHAIERIGSHPVMIWSHHVSSMFSSELGSPSFSDYRLSSYEWLGEYNSGEHSVIFLEGCDSLGKPYYLFWELIFLVSVLSDYSPDVVSGFLFS